MPAAEPAEAGEHPAGKGGATVPHLRAGGPRWHLQEDPPLRHSRLPAQGGAGAGPRQGFPQVLTYPNEAE